MQQTNPIQWLEKRALMSLHEEQIAEHGGLRGFRDEGLLESALVRPQQILHYREDASLAELAAAYGFGIARNHPLADGNKRAAYLAIDTFCRLNGWAIKTSQVEVVQAMLALAASDMTEEQLTAWIQERLVAYQPAP